MSTYAKLKLGCPPRGNSVTSNAKFISPWSEVYYESSQPMMTYPGGYLPRVSVPTPTFQKAWNISSTGCPSCNNGSNISKKIKKIPQILSSLDAIGTEN
jgi:hypothetical protein